MMLEHSSARASGYVKGDGGLVGMDDVLWGSLDMLQASQVG